MGFNLFGRFKKETPKISKNIQAKTIDEQILQIRMEMSPLSAIINNLSNQDKEVWQNIERLKDLKRLGMSQNDFYNKKIKLEELRFTNTEYANIIDEWTLLDNELFILESNLDKLSK